jgi:hypothetical protein
MLSASIGYDFPVMDSIGERPVRYHCSEVVVRFIEENIPTVFGKLDVF